MIKVLYVDEGRYIIKYNEREFLMVNLSDPKKHRYANSPDVFLRFMPFAETFKGDGAPIINKVNELKSSGILKN